MAAELQDRGNGILDAPGARLIDRSDHKRLPIGDDGFTTAMAKGTLVDKTMLIADVLDSGYTATLFCRPRRFGKTLNLTMLKAFLEAPEAGGLETDKATALFRGTRIWEAEDGRYLEQFQRYPVVFFSLRTAKGATWDETLGALRNLVTAEFRRHAYLSESKTLTQPDRDFVSRICDGTASDAEYADSLIGLTRALRLHHGAPVVVLIDEYDAPVMAAYSAPDGGYYDHAVSFLKRWLTGGLKDGGEALNFACLTGVQRISKESIFSDLNNLVVSTPLSPKFDEYFGFTDDEVSALASYIGLDNDADEARRWYDGYRFGNVDVYNPWSILNFFDTGCVPDVYWGNTSSNSVIGDLVRHADSQTLERVYELLQPQGIIRAPLNLGVVFPDVGMRADAIWSMLYLAGYLTTEDTALPNNTRILRRLRIPNAEVRELYRSEVVERFGSYAGGQDRLNEFHEALVRGDEGSVQQELSQVLRDSASSFDLTSENSLHMLMLGLCFGIPGYGDPVSNRESGYGRPDIQLIPEKTPFFVGERPLITIELKFGKDADSEALERLAHEGIEQIERQGYDEVPSLSKVNGCVRWGIACSGKHVVAACEKAKRLER